MATTVGTPTGFTSPGELKKLLLDLLPNQGGWTEEEYLWLTDHTNRFVEFTDGHIEVLPMPTDNHQAILKFLVFAFSAYIDPLGGKLRFSPLRLRIRTGKFREPDLILLRSAKDPRRENRFWKGADLTLEVVRVLRLEGTAYVEHGVFSRGATATSALLTGFAVNVDAVMDAD
jgi:Uma2 family endonuclease